MYAGIDSTFLSLSQQIPLSHSEPLVTTVRHSKILSSSRNTARTEAQSDGNISHVGLRRVEMAEDPEVTCGEQRTCGKLLMNAFENLWTNRCVDSTEYGSGQA